MELSDILKESSPELYDALNSEAQYEKVLSLLLELTTIGGYMQKVGEELDHMVGFDRQKLVTYTLNLLSILLIAGSIWGVAYEVAVPDRWTQIAQKTVIQGPQ